MLFPVVEVTKSLSNLIKYSFVNLADKEARVIDYEKDSNNFVPLEKNSKVIMRSAEEVEKEAALHAMEETAAANDEFSPGVPVVNFDEILVQKKEEAEQEAEEILAEARRQAEAILQTAESQVEELHQKAYEEGVEEGKKEGLAKAEEEVARTRQELDEAMASREREYQKMIEEIEPHYVEVLCSLVQKITGILLSDKKDLLLHLIRSGIADMEPAKRYTIRVSPEDVLLVEGNKDKIVQKAGLGISVEVQEEKGLGKDECIIESDTQMVDCGFKTQLDNLVSTLRMLAQ